MWGHSCRCPHFDAGGSHEPAALLAAALALYGACGLDGEPLRARFAAAAAAAAAGRGRGGGGVAGGEGGGVHVGELERGQGYRGDYVAPGELALGASLSAGAFGEVVRLREARAVRAFLKEASLLRSARPAPPRPPPPP
eukprot:tig00021127_g18846.t1